MKISGKNVRGPKMNLYPVNKFYNLSQMVGQDLEMQGVQKAHDIVIFFVNENRNWGQKLELQQHDIKHSFRTNFI